MRPDMYWLEKMLVSGFIYYNLLNQNVNGGSELNNIQCKKNLQIKWLQFNLGFSDIFDEM